MLRKFKSKEFATFLVKYRFDMILTTIIFVGDIKI